LSFPARQPGTYILERRPRERDRVWPRADEGIRPDALTNVPPTMESDRTKRGRLIEPGEGLGIVWMGGDAG
jgi:hypothetical protein